MIEKQFIKPRELVHDAFALARNIYESGFRPNVVLVLWRGGTPVGIVVHEFFHYKGIDMHHAVVKAVSYDGIEQRRTAPKIEHLGTIMNDFPADSRVLVVDDIFDTGHTLKTVVDGLRDRVKQVRTATLYVRAGHQTVDIRPDFFLHDVHTWVVFPHELVGLTQDEIRIKDEVLYDLLHGKRD